MNPLNKSRTQSRTQSSFNIRTLDAKLLSLAVNERGWSLEADDYVARIRDGQTLNAGLHLNTNAFI